MIILDNWALTLLLLIPLATILLLFLVPPQHTGWIRWGAIIPTWLSIALVIWIVFRFDPDYQGYQLIDWFSWFYIPMGQGENLAITYSIGLDGISLPFIGLTSVVAAIVMWVARTMNVEKRSFYQWLCITQWGAYGLFLANSLFLFLLFLQTVILSLYFLLAQFKRNHRYLTPFLYMTGTATSFILWGVGILSLLAGSLEFDEIHAFVAQMMEHIEAIEVTQQTLLWSALISLLIGFGLLLALVPFHHWAIQLLVHAPIPIAILSVGVILKIGLYGIFRFGVDLFPSWMLDISSWILWIALLNFLIAAGYALWQKELRSLLGYASISQISIPLLGFSTLQISSMQTVIIQTMIHSLLFVCLFLLIGILSRQMRTTDHRFLQGIITPMPMFSALLISVSFLLFFTGIEKYLLLFPASVPLFSLQGWVGIIAVLCSLLYLIRLLSILWGEPYKRFESLSPSPVGVWLPVLLTLILLLVVILYPDPIWYLLQNTVQNLLPEGGAS